MKRITRSPDQIPGLIDLYAVPVTQIESIDGFNVNLIENATIYHARWAIDTITHQNDAARDAAGPFYNAKITGFIYGIDYASTTLLDEMLRHKFVVVYRDSKGFYMRLGNADIGLLFKYKETSEAPIGYQVEFAARITEVAKPVHLLTGVFPPPVIPNFSVGIDSAPVFFSQHYFSGQGVYPAGTQVTISAMSPEHHADYPNNMMEFVQWLKRQGNDFVVFSYDNPHTFTLTEDINLVALYQPV